MRAFAVLVCATLALVAATSSAARPRTAATGTLTGRTEIHVGCPAVRPGGGCNPWRLYPHAHFTVTRLTAGGAAVAGSARTVESDARARFAVVLHAGTYLVTPASETQASGAAVRVHVAGGSTTTVTVRFTSRFRRV